jgi:subtilisin family serine protease
MLAPMRRAALLALIAAAALAAPAHADDPLTGRLLVSLDRGDGRAHAAAPVLARAAARRAGPSVAQVGLVTVRPAAGASLRDLARRLRRDPAVRAVSLERRARPRLIPNDPALTDPETAPGAPPGTPVQWWADRSGLFQAWDVARGTGALVAVIDTGVDGTHPELAPKVRGSIDTDPTPGAGGALTDEMGHGTHVSSMACGAAGDGLGLAGAGLDCGLLAIKTDFSDASVVQSVVEAADRGAHVINLSFGTDGTRRPPQALVDALAYATSRGAVLVAAAADVVTQEQGDPANVLQPTGTGPDLSSNVGLSVTAATFSGARADFAGNGSQISVASYGTFERAGTGPDGVFGALPGTPTDLEQGSIAPPSPPCGCRTVFRGDARYAYLKGTSMATAIVSGVAALVRRLNPDLRPPEVVRLLKVTARRPAGTGWSPELGWGIVDARAAVESARLIDRRAPVSRVAARARRTRLRTITLRWRGVDAGPRGVAVSGIAAYELWRAVNGRRAVKIARTTTTSRRVRLRPGRRSAFFTVAIDRAGNREPRPLRPDVRVRALP